MKALWLLCEWRYWNGSFWPVADRLLRAWFRRVADTRR